MSALKSIYSIFVLVLFVVLSSCSNEHENDAILGVHLGDSRESVIETFKEQYGEDAFSSYGDKYKLWSGRVSKPMEHAGFTFDGDAELTFDRHDKLTEIKLNHSDYTKSKFYKIVNSFEEYYGEEPENLSERESEKIYSAIFSCGKIKIHVYTSGFQLCSGSVSYTLKD